MNGKEMFCLVPVLLFVGTLKQGPLYIICVFWSATYNIYNITICVAPFISSRVCMGDR